MAEDAGRHPSWRRPRTALLAFAVAATVGVGWVQTHRPEPTPRFCTAEGLLLPDGTMLGRDPGQDCAWVDQDGNRVSPQP